MLDKVRKIPKYYIFVFTIAILKMILMGLCSSDYQDKLFLPFIMEFAKHGGNPYQKSYDAGITNAFPYPIIMLFIQAVPGKLIWLLKIKSMFWINFLFKFPSFLIDLFALWFLTKTYSKKRRYIAVFYYGSPIIIYAVYMHGQLDLLPTIIMLVAICVIASKNKYRLLLGTILTILGLLCKLHILAVLPIIVFYIFNRDGFRKSLLYITTVIMGVVLGFLPVYSPGFEQMVLLNPEQNALTKVFFDFASVELYIPVVAVLIVYLMTFKLSFINQELFVNLCSMVFSIFLALCPPMPGWYVWVVPYVAVFFVQIDREKYKNIVIYAFLNLVYLVYFVLFHNRNVVDLYILGKDTSIVKIENEILSNATFTILSGTLLYIVFSMYKLGVSNNSLYRRKDKPFTIGIAGDSGAGKSTMIGILEKCLGTRNLLFIEGDGDHRWERGNENWQEYTALNPKANYLYKQAEDLKHLRNGSSISRVDYNHDTGKFTQEKRIGIKKYVLLCGLHALYLPQVRKNLDLKIYMDSDENLRRFWKIRRDTKERGYSKDAIIRQIEDRMPDAFKYIYPQKEYADIIIHSYDKTLVDCTDIDHEVKMSVCVTVSAAINVEPLVDELRMNGLRVEYDFTQDLKQQIVDIDAEDLEKMELPIESIANNIVPQLDEITRENLSTDKYNGKDSIIVLFLLLMISIKMKGEM